MKKAEIILHVQDRTEHKADNRIDFGVALELRLQKFVKEKEFWWRRAIASFPTVAGEALYILSAQNPVIIGVEKIRAAQLIVGGVACPVDAIWDERAVMAARRSVTQGQPKQYTMEPGKTGVIRLICIPDAAYIFEFAYLRSYQVDAAQEDIEGFVPESDHFAVLDGLEMDTMEFLYGAESNKFAVAQATYQDSLEKCFLPSDFTTERIDTFTGDRLGNEAIRSTE